MGSNFGDIDSDGFLDFYLGTGYPDYEAVTPNVMYRTSAAACSPTSVWKVDLAIFKRATPSLSPT